MTFAMQDILKSKRALRERLAARPYAEKLRLLEQLRERSLAIAARSSSDQDGANPVSDDAPLRPDNLQDNG
ncbi:MAG: hypothetical protein HY710_08750 [Candidatus Latescibacteria bacterium]|nr:hypothetical protein [Candidatus Latescibacterota bacterium]